MIIYTVDKTGSDDTTYITKIIESTLPLLIYENDNMVFGKSYLIKWRTNLGSMKMYHSGSECEFTEIENGAPFVARGKILAIEMEEGLTITVESLTMVAV